MEVVVDRKHRVTIPKQLRHRMRIDAGSTLVVNFVNGLITMRPRVPVAKPTETLWGLVGGAADESPKSVARRAIVERIKRGMAQD